MNARPWRRLSRGTADWPAGWRDLRDEPGTVYVTGDPAALGVPALALVGTRGCTARGLAVTRRLAGELAGRGWVIVSGLAQGIDAEAHRAALDAGGRTVAVMGTGPERTYPGEHRSLRARLEKSGCCVTEIAPGFGGGGRWCFPRRNRLIAALAAGVIVIEAPRRSGALLTARQASDLGRPVWAVPGPVDAQQSVGCHELLREGALVCTGCGDVDPVLAPPAGTSAAVCGPPLPVAGSAARWILDRLELEGTDAEELLANWPGTAAMWAEGLLALELAGLIRRLSGGRLAPRIWRS